MKLIKKTEGWYNLYDGEIGIGSTHKELQGFKLSLKNCEAIERGYDLDELAYDFSWNYQSDPNYGDTIHVFKEGFQKALEILGDKKFSEEDIREAYSRGQTNSPIQSLQHVEWDVEIRMEEITLPFGANQFYKDYKPKLEDGYIILKRI
jgi:hypothetical protein